jgi:tRNA-specific 2-thiouridylase
VTDDGTLLVSFDKQQADVTPGQYAVFYDGERCLGGAVIERVISADDFLRMTG